MPRVALCLGVALSVACGTDVLGPDADHLQMTVSLSTPEIVVGDTVEIRVVGTNTTRRTLQLMTRECAAFVVRVALSSDIVVFQHPRLCNDIGALHVLEPGESIEETVLFDGTGSPIGFRDANGKEVKLRMATGRYTVVAWPMGADGNRSDPVDLRIR